jgi:pSer/pThr/pTyr-binding forkhead associated (FHA) protein
MPRLILKYKNNTLAIHRLAPGASITIGRREDNDIVIQNIAVSGHHARIDSVGERFLLTDLQSKNGCIINDKQVNSHWLEHDDTIMIGKHTLDFGYMKGEVSSVDEDDQKGEQTLRIENDLQKSAAPNDDENAAAGESADSQPIAKLLYLEGGNGEVLIDNDVIKIGKDTASDIVLSGLMVGPTAATISKSKEGYRLNYVSGIAKVKLNGKPIKQPEALNNADEIEIGTSRWRFSFQG